jgi:polar amino acid transport system substrate-binding protein
MQHWKGLNYGTTHRNFARLFFGDMLHADNFRTADWGSRFMSTRPQNRRLGRLKLLLGTIIAVLFSIALEGSAQSKGKISFLILSGTVEPLMITTADDPMAGGIITEIVEAIFAETEYEVVPRIMPWKRMATELKIGSDWVTYGFQGGFDPDMPHEMSNTPVLSFNHVAITLRSNHLQVVEASDVSGKTAILVENFHYPGLDPYLDTPIVGDGDGTIKTVRAFSPKGTLRMLRHGRGDVVFGYHARMLYSLTNTGLELSDLRFQDASQIIPTKPLYIAMSPSHPPEVKQLINEGLQRLEADGTLARILRNYSGPEDLIE